MSDDKPKRRRSTTTKPKRPRLRTTVSVMPDEPEIAGEDTQPAKPAPARTVAPSPPRRKPPVAVDISSIKLSRDSVADAVYLDALDRGLSKREACAAAEDIADRLRLDDSHGEDIHAREDFYDLRSEQDYVYPGGRNKTKMRGTAPVLRDPSTITTIVVHQTAVEFGVTKRAIKASGGDVELARARRALDVACHAMVFRAGYLVAAHPLRAYVNHGNRFNDHSLGLEIEGRYPGLLDDPSTAAREDLKTTWGGKPTVLTDETVIIARAAIAWLVKEGRAEGMPLTDIVSHRQSNDMRRSDPGEEIWRRVVLDYAVQELGLIPKLGSPWRQGRPVPFDWDPNGIGSY